MEIVTPPYYLTGFYSSGKILPEKERRQINLVFFSPIGCRISPLQSPLQIYFPLMCSCIGFRPSASPIPCISFHLSVVFLAVFKLHWPSPAWIGTVPFHRAQPTSQEYARPVLFLTISLPNVRKPLQFPFRSFRECKYFVRRKANTSPRRRRLVARFRPSNSRIFFKLL